MAIIVSFTAIHQKLESDGTEKVEGSMTRRLENVLNSKIIKKLALEHINKHTRTHPPIFTVRDPWFFPAGS